MKHYLVKENANGMYVTMKGIVKDRNFISERRRFPLTQLSTGEKLFDDKYIAISFANMLNNNFFGKSVSN